MGACAVPCSRSQLMADGPRACAGLYKTGFTAGMLGIVFGAYTLIKVRPSPRGARVRSIVDVGLSGRRGWSGEERVSGAAVSYVAAIQRLLLSERGHESILSFEKNSGHAVLCKWCVCVLLSERLRACELARAGPGALAYIRPRFRTRLGHRTHPHSAMEGSPYINRRTATKSYRPKSYVSTARAPLPPDR